MNTREAIRNYLDSQDGPRWVSEILAALREQGIVIKPSRISGMVLDGALVRHTEAVPHSYSVGHRPRPVMTEAERTERRKDTDRKRDANRKAKRLAEGKKPRPYVERAPSIKTVTIKAQDGAETFEQFKARGGQVQTLPGFQRDNVFPPRRPTWAANNRSMA